MHAILAKNHSPVRYEWLTSLSKSSKEFFLSIFAKMYFHRITQSWAPNFFVLRVILQLLCISGVPFCNMLSVLLFCGKLAFIYWIVIYREYKLKNQSNYSFCCYSVWYVLWKYFSLFFIQIIIIIRIQTNHGISSLKVGSQFNKRWLFKCFIAINKIGFIFEYFIYI